MTTIINYNVVFYLWRKISWIIFNNNISFSFIWIYILFFSKK